MLSSGLFFRIFNRNMYSVLKRAALDVLLAHFLWGFLFVFFVVLLLFIFYYFFFILQFLLTAFSASLGAGRMILRTDMIFFIVLILHVETIQKNAYLAIIHGHPSWLLLDGKIEICSIFYILCFFMCTSTEKLECIIIVGYNKHYIVDCFS